MLAIRSLIPVCCHAQVNLPIISIGQKRAASTLSDTLANGSRKCEKVAKVSFENKQPLPSQNIKGMRVAKSDYSAELPIKSFEEYKKSSTVQKVCGNDEEKLRRAYQGFVEIEETQRAIAKKGGNPARMI